MFRKILLVGAASAGAVALYVGSNYATPAALATDQTTMVTEQAPVSGIPASAAGTVVPSVTRARVLGLLRGMTEAYKRIDTIDAKLTTWGEWARLQGVTPGMKSVDPNKLVWLVGASGDVVFVGNHGMSVGWGGMVLDANTGEVLMALGQPSGEPAYFKVLVDLAPR